MLSYDQKLATVQGQWAIDYEAMIVDSHPRNSPDEPLAMRTLGRLINHPSFSNSVIIITYSERGRPKELDPQLETEGKQLIDGVLLESEPGKPLH
jgi:hypothetical protein